MVEFTVHDESSAPEEVADALAQIRQRFGFIPNMYGVMAESPQAFNAYQAVSGQFRKSSLSKQAQQVVWLTVSRHNGCEYCVAVHSTMAAAARVDAAIIDAIREDKPIDDAQLEAVRRFTKAVVEQRGWVPEEELEALFAAGFAQRQVLDVLTGVAMKTLSNYTNHIAHTPLDEAFAAHSWTRAE